MFPAVLNNLARMLTESLNLIFIGKVKVQAEIIAAVGVGNMTQNLIGLSVILGLNSALDTLVSQAAGAGNIQLCGIYRNRAVFIMSVVFIPIMVIL